MITLFTIPRAFIGEDKVRQENTLGAWTRLVPRPEIILFCDDPGVVEAAAQFDCVHVPGIGCNKKGIPYISHAFRLASQMASNDVLCYANADIIFVQDFITAVNVVIQNFEQPFLIVGQRRNVSVPGPLRFTGNWQQRLRAQIKQRGEASAVDYFIYSRGAIVDIPDFLVGSPKWDNWLVHDAEKRGIQIISATQAITCIHQQHKHVWPAEGVRYNRRLWQKSGGGVGLVHSGSWVLGPGATLRGKPGVPKGKAWVAPSVKTWTVPKVTARPRRRSKSKPQPRSRRTRPPKPPRSPRPARVAPKDELGLPINLNVSARELVSSAKKLRRQVKVRRPARKKHSHGPPSARERLLAERAKLRQVKDTILAARIAARDARLAGRKKRRP